MEIKPLEYIILNHCINTEPIPLENYDKMIDFILLLNKEDKKYLFNKFREYLDENDEYEFLIDNFKERTEKYSKYEFYIYMIYVSDISYYLINKLGMDIELLPNEIKNKFISN